MYLRENGERVYRYRRMDKKVKQKRGLTYIKGWLTQPSALEVQNESDSEENSLPAMLQMRKL